MPPMHMYLYIPLYYPQQSLTSAVAENTPIPILLDPATENIYVVNAKRPVTLKEVAVICIFTVMSLSTSL